MPGLYSNRKTPAPSKPRMQAQASGGLFPSDSRHCVIPDELVFAITLEYECVVADVGYTPSELGAIQEVNGDTRFAVIHRVRY